MEYAAVQSLISDTVSSLGYEVMFGHGRESDFNQMKDRKYPLMWLDPMTVSASTPDTFENTESWAVTIVCLVKANLDDKSSDQNSLVSFAESICRDFVMKLDESEAMQYSGKYELKPLHRTTFGTDHTSGCILSF